MKKIITLSIISLLVISAPSFVFAQGKNQGQKTTDQQIGSQQRIQDPTLHDEDATTAPMDAQQGQMGQETNLETGNAGKKTENANLGLETAKQSLNRVVERTNNPEIGQQARIMVENHQQIQTKTQTAIQTMNKRSGLAKLLIGPDYKNAGEVRSSVVNLRNDIEQLQKMKTDASTEDVLDIQIAIDELQTEADSLDNQLEEQLSGFSLFGWLAKRFSN